MPQHWLSKLGYSFRLALLVILFMFIPFLHGHAQSLHIGPVIHLYLGYTHAIMSLWANILKMMIFFKKSHFTLLNSHALCALSCILQWIYCVGCIHVSDLFAKMPNEVMDLLQLKIDNNGVLWVNQLISKSRYCLKICVHIMSITMLSIFGVA